MAGTNRPIESPVTGLSEADGKMVSHSLNLHLLQQVHADQLIYFLNKWSG